MEDNFEKKIREVMNDPPSLPFDEKAWGQMQQRLTVTAAPKSSWRNLLPIALLSLLLLLGGTYFFKYSIASEKVLLLEKQLQQERILSKQALKVDTLTERHHIIIYDTSYVYVQKAIPSKNTAFSNNDYKQKNNTTTNLANYNSKHFFPLHSSTAHSLFASRYQNSFSPYYNNLAMLSMSTRHLSPYTAVPGVAKENDKSQNNTSDNYSPNNDITIPSLITNAFKNEFANLDVAFTLSEIEKIKRKRGLAYYASRISPSSFSVGVYVGSSREQAIDLPDPIFEANYSVGIKGVLNYGAHVSVVLGAEYFKNAYEAEAEQDGVNTEIYTRGFPALPPLSDSDKFHEVILDFQYLQIPMSVQYNFLPKRKIQPYLGLGLISRKALRSTVEYEYINGDGLYSVYNYNVLPSAFQLNTMLTYLGFQIDITKQLHFQVEGRTEFDLGAKGMYLYDNTQFLKINSGFQYSF